MAIRKFAAKALRRAANRLAGVEHREHDYLVNTQDSIDLAIAWDFNPHLATWIEQQIHILVKHRLIWLIRPESDSQPARLRFRLPASLVLSVLKTPTDSWRVTCPLLESLPSKKQAACGSPPLPTILNYLIQAGQGVETGSLLYVPDYLHKQLEHWGQLQNPFTGPNKPSLLAIYAALPPPFHGLISPHPFFDCDHYVKQLKYVTGKTPPLDRPLIVDYLAGCTLSDRYRTIEPSAQFNPYLWNHQGGEKPNNSSIFNQAPLVNFLNTMNQSESGVPKGHQKLTGSVDVLTPKGVLKGWCSPKTQGKPEKLSVFINNVLLGEGVANEPRPDVALSGAGVHDCGFSIKLNLDAIEHDYLKFISNASWSIVTSDQQATLGSGQWPLKDNEKLFLAETLTKRCLQVGADDVLKSCLTDLHDGIILDGIREQIFLRSAVSAAADSWDSSLLLLVREAAFTNPYLQQGVEAECSTRSELILLALHHLHYQWNKSQPKQTLSNDRLCRSLADELGERTYYGPSARERQRWDKNLRKLFNIVIANAVQRAVNRPETHDLLLILTRLSEEVFGDLELTRNIIALVMKDGHSNNRSALRLQLRAGDAIGVMTALFHQRCNGLEPELSPFDHAQAILKISGDSLSGIETALATLLPLIPEYQARNSRSSQCRRMLDQLGWHVEKLGAELIDQLVDIDAPQALGLTVRERTINLLSQISQALWAGDAGRSGCTPLPRSTKPPLRWLLIGERSLPQCWLYRVEQKRQQLERCGAEVRCIDKGDLDAWSFSQQVAWADAVLFCRTPATYGVIRALTFARHCGKRVFADIDDLVVSSAFPAPYITYGGSISRSIHRRLGLDAPLQRWPLEQADAVITSTAALADACRGASAALADKPITVLPNLPLPELLGLARRLAHQPPQRAPRLVVSSGTLAHKQIWSDQLAPAIAQLLGNHPQLRLSLIGHLEVPACLQPFSTRISTVPYSDYSHYLQHLAEGSIALVPLEDHPTTHCKSAIKWMEASLLGLATVCSPVRAYTDAATAEQHLLLAEDQQAWVHQVERLLADPELLARLSSQARQHAQASFHEQLGEQIWNTQFLAASSDSSSTDHNPQPASPHRQKLLVINVFFAPQSIGGATRVAQDQVRDILKDHSDIYDVTVLCIDHDPWQRIDVIQTISEDSDKQDNTKSKESLPLDPWQRIDVIQTISEDSDKQDNTKSKESLPLDLWHWHGARILRLAVPPRPWADIQDARVESFCRQWFQDESFDLIHCHCTQVLTASPLVVAKQLGIPYLITLHDAWWLSPELFLVSPAGRQIDPAKPFDHIDGTPTPEEKAIALERRSILAGILRGAQQRLAVSDPFRKVYERAGVEEIDVRENQFTPMPPPQPRPPRRPGDPLRVCHVGGMAMHKGYHILRQAVHLLPRELNLEFTVIDHRLQEDQSTYSSSWNGYPVRFLPPVPMEKMADFYASQDVLVAPSIWPESFGLVTREALSAGLQVIATDTGALAEPLRHSSNGLIIRSGDPYALATSISSLTITFIK